MKIINARFAEDFMREKNNCPCVIVILRQTSTIAKSKHYVKHAYFMTNLNVHNFHSEKNNLASLLPQAKQVEILLGHVKELKNNDKKTVEQKKIIIKKQRIRSTSIFVNAKVKKKNGKKLMPKL